MSPRRDAQRAGQRTPRRSRFLAGLFITPDGRKLARERMRAASFRLEGQSRRNCYSYAFMSRNNVVSRRMTTLVSLCLGKRDFAASESSVNLGSLDKSVERVLYFCISLVFNVLLISEQRHFFPKTSWKMYIKLYIRKNLCKNILI